MGRRHAVRVVHVISCDKLLEGEEERAEAGDHHDLARHVALAVVDLLGRVGVEFAL